MIEAVEAHSEHGRRILDDIAVAEVCQDGRSPMKRHAQLHRQHPDRELGFVHTERETLDIEERQWLGIRGLHASHAAR